MEATPAIRPVRPSSQSRYRYYILVDASGDRVGFRSFETHTAAAKYVARNYGEDEAAEAAADAAYDAHVNR